MLYFGRGLQAVIRRTTEPALIDPTLDLSAGQTDWSGRGMNYWPSYDGLTPLQRSTYLAWLADGRRYPGTPIGYVYLFLYGLERRALIDARGEAEAAAERPTIAAEVRRLLEIYGGNASFRGYATGLLGVLAIYQPAAAHPPPLDENRWVVPMALRVALGRFAGAGEPITAPWARAWAWYDPEIHPRTAQVRCAAEFERLFAIRFQQRFPAGLVVRPGKRRVRVVHRPASAGLGAVDVPTDLPDVFEFKGARSRLAELVDTVTNELDAYSRWLGRNPRGQGSPSAAALLPVDLVDLSAGPVSQLHGWVNERLGTRAQTMIEGSDLIARWSSTGQQKLTKSDSVSIAQLLSHMGVGIEPDVRFGQTPVSSGPAILFRLDGVAPAAPTPEYLTLATLLHLAVVVGYADGELAPPEYEQMAGHLEEALGLSPGEKTRLRAHLQWLVAARVTTSGLKSRLASIAAVDRQRIADFLISVVTADGVVHPAEVSTLVSVYKLLGLDPTAVPSELHGKVTQSARPRAARPARGPVVVKPATAGASGFALPRPRPSEPEAADAVGAKVAGGGLMLDEDVIAERIVESAKVSALLATIFNDDEITTLGPSAPAQGSAAPARTVAKSVAGYSEDHIALLRELAGSATWSRHDFDALAEKHGLLPGGALDVLNEAALDLADDLVLEGDDDLTVNPEALREMLK